MKMLAELHAAIQSRLPELEGQLAQLADDDGITKFYEESYKAPLRLTEAIVRLHALLLSLAPKRPLHPWFVRIVADALEPRDTNPRDDQAAWFAANRPLAEAFLHARYFLEQAVAYGRDPSGPIGRIGEHVSALIVLFDLDQRTS